MASGRVWVVRIVRHVGSSFHLGYSSIRAGAHTVEGTLLIDIDPELERIVGQDGLVRDPRLRMVYECDGYTLDRAVPERVVLPHTIDELKSVVKVAHEAGWSIVPRGAGTGLAGGTLAAPGARDCAHPSPRDRDPRSREPASARRGRRGQPGHQPSRPSPRPSLR